MTAFRRRLAWLVALGAVVRITLLVRQWNRPLQLNDSVWYSSMASGLRHGEFFRAIIGGGPSAEHAPLTSVLMTPLSFLSDPVNGQRLTSTLCGIATVALVGLLARRVAGDTAGLLAAAIAAVYPNLWVNDGVVMAESAAMLLVTGFLLALLHHLDAPSWRRAALVGALAALAALTRSELLLLALGAAVVVLLHRRDWARAGVVLGTAALVIAPWSLVNLARFDRPVLMTTNDGTTLLGAYCDDIFAGANKGGWSVFCVLNAPEVDGDDSVRAAQQRRWALEYARDHAGELPGVVLARVARAADLYGLSDLVHSDVLEQKPRVAVWAGIVAWWLLAPLAVWGALRTRRRDRAVLLLPVVTVAVTTVVFYGHHRLRAPLEPSVVVLAAVALVHLLPRQFGAGAAPTPVSPPT